MQRPPPPAGTLTNRTIFTQDNLHVMRGLESETFDLIYLDPPFNSKKQWSAPIGSKAAHAEFKDTWTLSDIDELEVDLMRSTHPKLAALIDAVGKINGNGDKSYLLMMAPRLIEMRRLLKPTGSIYLHCDPTMSHSLKLLLDAVFGADCFRNEIVWCYSGPSNTKKYFPRKHDILFFYTRSSTWLFNHSDIKVPYAKLRTGHTQGIFKQDFQLDPAGKVPESWWAEFSPVGRLKRERTGYPTQKPVALLERIIKASSPEGGWVFDPFCGCATACVASERLNRNWVGIDLSDRAADLVVMRFQNELGLWKNHRGLTHREDLPTRTKDITRTPPKQLKVRLYGEQGGHCNGCRKHFEPQNLEIDHIVPRSRGGHEGDDNKQLLCSYCNRAKGSKSNSYLQSKQPNIDTYKKDAR